MHTITFLFGQLGNESTNQSRIPVNVSNLTGIKAITTRANHTCSLLTDGTVKCWGYNNNGQLGDLTTIDRPYPIVAYSGAKEISTGYYDSSCAINNEDRINCWGGNSSFQQAITQVSSAFKISSGWGFNCAITTWSNNSSRRRRCRRR